MNTAINTLNTLGNLINDISQAQIQIQDLLLLLHDSFEVGIESEQELVALRRNRQQCHEQINQWLPEINKLSQQVIAIGTELQQQFPTQEIESLTNDQLHQLEPLIADDDDWQATANDHLTAIQQDLDTMFHLVQEYGYLLVENE